MGERLQRIYLGSLYHKAYTYFKNCGAVLRKGLTSKKFFQRHSSTVIVIPKNTLSASKSRWGKLTNFSLSPPSNYAILRLKNGGWLSSTRRFQAGISAYTRFRSSKNEKTLDSICHMSHAQTGPVPLAGHQRQFPKGYLYFSCVFPPVGRTRPDTGPRKVCLPVRHGALGGRNLCCLYPADGDYPPNIPPIFQYGSPLYSLPEP